jgi:hypothetical protein
MLAGSGMFAPHQIPWIQTPKLRSWNSPKEREETSWESGVSNHIQSDSDDDG